MQLVATARGYAFITIETKQDRTDVLTRWREEKLKRLKQEGIRGFVFKARSPSCGVYDAELFSTSGASICRRPGLFTKSVISSFPALPVEDEERLRDPAVREEFLARILA
jgi:uncharacterized protein YbbK (DUF523 family)